MQYVRLQKQVVLLTGGRSTHKISAGARTGIGRFVKRFFEVLGACQTSYDTRAPLESYDINYQQKSSGARPLCANAGREPSGHRTVPGQCHFTLIDPTKRRGI